jgi:hypothetical protein
MFGQRYTLDHLSTLLVPQTEWHPYPTIMEREAWALLPAAVRARHTAAGEALLGYDWPPLPATLFLQYARVGNRRNYETPHFERRAALGRLVIAECIENSGRLLDDMVNGIWAICEESFWGVSAHIRYQRASNTLPDTSEIIVDLFAAETAALLAWTGYLLGEQLDAVSPVVRPRMRREIDLRMLTPCLERDDFWWMGFVQRPDGRRVNNWNPWICSNWLVCALLSERDEGRRRASVYKALCALDNFIDPYPRDGGCDEGPSYWGRAGASLFDCLELLYSVTSGQINLYGEPLIQEIGRFLQRVHIADDYYINFADAPALVYPDAMLVYQYGQRIGDEDMMRLGAWLVDRQGLQSGAEEASAEARSAEVKKRVVPTSLSRKLPALFSLPTLSAMEATPPLPRDSWLPVIEVMVARDQAGSSAGMLVAAKGGHNNESHNHNDIGNFVIYVDGKPVIVDAGVETYTAKTFSDQRYAIWTMQSAYHSLLPTLDGVQQQPGERFKASVVVYAANDYQAQLTLDLTSAYPPEAHLQRWQRTISFQRGKSVTITDQYTVTQAVGEIMVGLLTPCAVGLEAGKIVFQPRPILAERMAGAGSLLFDAHRFTVATETIFLTDEWLRETWGETLTRVVLCAAIPPVEDHWVWRFLPRSQ